MKKEMHKALAGLKHQESEVVEENWFLKATTYDTALRLSDFGKSSRKHQDRFDDTDKKAKAVLEERNNARVL